MVLLPSLNEKLESSVCLSVCFFFKENTLLTLDIHFQKYKQNLEVTELAVCQLRYNKK